MTVIAIHAGRRPLARIEIDLDRSAIDRRDPDFPVITAFSGRETGIGAGVSEATVLGAFLDGADRKAISAGEVTTLTISCGTTETYPVSDRGGSGALCLERGGREIPIDTTPVGSLLTEEQRHFLCRAPRTA